MWRSSWRSSIASIPFLLGHKACTLIEASISYIRVFEIGRHARLVGTLMEFRRGPD